MAYRKLPEQRRSSSSKPKESHSPLHEADYKNSVKDVYRSLTLDHISLTASLETLTAVQDDFNYTLISD